MISVQFNFLPAKRILQPTIKKALPNVYTSSCALYIAVAELKYFSDIPPVVSIDEAISLVRKYSTEESMNFVNGILAAVKKDMEA